MCLGPLPLHFPFQQHQNLHPYLIQVCQMPPQLSECAYIACSCDSTAHLFWVRDRRFSVSFCLEFCILHIQAHFLQFWLNFALINRKLLRKWVICFIFFKCTILYLWIFEDTNLEPRWVITHTLFFKTTLGLHESDNSFLRYDLIYEHMSNPEGRKLGIHFARPGLNVWFSQMSERYWHTLPYLLFETGQI